jgi:hypothetical protein
MKRSGFGIALLVAFGCLSDGADAQKVKNIPVLGTFRCAEPGGLSGCATGDRIRGDGNVTPYPAQIGSSGNPLTMQIELGRFLAVHPGVPEAGSTSCNPCLAVPLYNQVMWTDFAHLLVTVIDAQGNELAGGFNAIPVGGSRNARGKLNVWDPTDDQVLWVYRFHAIDYPGSSDLIVTRPSNTEWIVQTAPQPLARLIYTGLRRKQVLQDEGVFAMPFALGIQK